MLHPPVGIPATLRFQRLRVMRLRHQRALRMLQQRPLVQHQSGMQRVQQAVTGSGENSGGIDGQRQRSAGGHG